VAKLFLFIAALLLVAKLVLLFQPFHWWLEGQCHEIFDPRFFSLKHPSLLGPRGQSLFEYKFEFADAQVQAV
jgi:hypothetical protein